MHRIDSDSVEENAHGEGKNGFRAGNPGLTGATALTPAWCNAVQEEPANVIEASGLPLDKNNNFQLLAAIRIIAAQVAAPLLDVLKKLFGGFNLLEPTETNGILAGDFNKKANLNSFTTPGVYGVWNSETTLDQIKGYWMVRVNTIGDEILQECTDYWDGQRRYLRRYKAGVWQETRIVDANYLQTALANMNSSEDFERRVMAIISAYNANPVGKFAYFASDYDSEAQRMVDGVRVWLRCNVAVSFDAATYPMLAIIYPSLVVPAQADQTREVSTGTDNDTETETYGYVFIRALDA